MADITAQSADGVVHNFPDDTKPEVIDKVMKDYARTHAAPSGTGAVSDQPAVNQPDPGPPKKAEDGAATRFLRGALDEGVDWAKSMFGAVRHPISAVAGLNRAMNSLPHADYFDMADIVASAFTGKDSAGMTASRAASAVGGAVGGPEGMLLQQAGAKGQQIGKQAASGDVAGAAGRATVNALPLLTGLPEGGLQTAEMVGGRAIPLTRSMVNPTGIASRVEKIAAGMPTGAPLRKVYMRAAEQTKQIISDAVASNASKTLSTPTSFLDGQTIVENAQAASGALKDSYRTIRQQVIDALPDVERARFEGMDQVAQNLKKTARGKPYGTQDRFYADVAAREQQEIVDDYLENTATRNIPHPGGYDEAAKVMFGQARGAWRQAKALDEMSEVVQSHLTGAPKEIQAGLKTAGARPQLMDSRGLLKVFQVDADVKRRMTTALGTEGYKNVLTALELSSRIPESSGVFGTLGLLYRASNVSAWTRGADMIGGIYAVSKALSNPNGLGLFKSLLRAGGGATATVQALRGIAAMAHDQEMAEDLQREKQKQQSSQK